jgi:hypothetical protein
MYPVTNRQCVPAILIATLLCTCATEPARAHGGGGGHGGGGHHATYSGHGSGYFGGGRFGSGISGSYPQNPWVGFPEDLPEARIRRFLAQHLPQPHLVQWLHRRASSS